MADKNVTMVHPKIKGKAIASKTAFDKVWSKKGWTIAPVKTSTESSDKATLESADKGPNSPNVPSAPSA